jgi:hypothetical protein
LSFMKARAPFALAALLLAISCNKDLVAPVTRDPALQVSTTGQRAVVVTQPQVATGAYDSCGLRDNGTVSCWGNNDYGQITVPATTNAIMSMSLGAGHSCAIYFDATVGCWGLTTYGATAVPTDLRATQVGAGQYHSCALATTGTVVCWGDNSARQLNVPAGLQHVIQLDVGAYGSCAVTFETTVACWGNAPFSTVPAGMTGVASVSVAFYEACAIMSDNSTKCWGQLKDPKPMSGVKKLSQNWNGVTTCALLMDSSVQCVDYDFNTGQWIDWPVPDGLVNVIDVSVGWDHACAAKSDGPVVCWGGNQLGETSVPPGLNLRSDASTSALYGLQMHDSRRGVDVYVGSAAFGRPTAVGGFTLQGTVVRGFNLDATGLTTSNGCTPLSNGTDVVGKVVLLVRGICTFTDKVKNAQNAGAIAAIIYNNTATEGARFMAGSDESIAIPAFFASQADGVAMTSAPTLVSIGAVPVTAPTITMPADMIVSSSVPKPVLFSLPTASVFAGSALVACNPASNTTFPLGPTTVACTAQDPWGHAADGTFTVTVINGATPVGDAVIVVPSDPNLTVNNTPVRFTFQHVTAAGVTSVASSSTGPALPPTWRTGDVPLYYELGTTATVTGTITVCSHLMGTFVRPTAVQLLHLESGGWVPLARAPNNADVCSDVTSLGSFVLAEPNLPPTLTTPAPIALPTLSSACFASWSPQLPATQDDASGVSISGVRSDGLTLGDVYPLGSTTINWTATDAQGLTATTDQQIGVVDMEAPVLNQPATVSSGTDAGVATKTLRLPAPAAHDNCQQVVVTSPQGSAEVTQAFPVGTTAITWIATDAAGNRATVVQNVTIVDDEAPHISAPPSIVVEATDRGSAMVTYGQATATDNVAVASVTCSVPNPGSFPLGVTTVTCVARDEAGNAASVSFEVRVVDTTPPTISTLQDIEVTATSPSGAVATFPTPSASDVAGDVQVSCSPASGTTFPVGRTMVTCTATDMSGNQRSSSFGVTVDPAPGATPTGSNVAVTPVDQSTGQPSSASITFGNVNGSGTTTVASSTVGQGGGPPAPANFKLGSPATMYDITTTASFSGLATVCINYSNVRYPNEQKLDLLHYENGKWVTLTTTLLDTQNKIICAQTSSFSPFLVAQEIYPFSGFFAPVQNTDAAGNYVVNQVKAGSAVPVKFSLGSDLGLNILASGSPSSATVACDPTASVTAVDETTTAGASTLSYDATSGQYIYVWKTDKSWTGCRQLVVKLTDGTEHRAAFKFSR